MPGKRAFETDVEATIETHTDLPAEVRASVLIQKANALRTDADRR